MEGKIYSPEKGKFVSVKTKHGQKVLKIYNEHLLGGDKHHNCAYCKIVNPQTGKMVSTYGQTGGRVIKSYVEQEGGGNIKYYRIKQDSDTNNGYIEKLCGYGTHTTKLYCKKKIWRIFNITSHVISLEKITSGIVLKYNRKSNSLYIVLNSSRRKNHSIEIQDINFEIYTKDNRKIQVNIKDFYENLNKQLLSNGMSSENAARLKVQNKETEENALAQAQEQEEENVGENIRENYNIDNYDQCNEEIVKYIDQSILMNIGSILYRDFQFSNLSIFKDLDKNYMIVLVSYYCYVKNIKPLSENNANKTNLFNISEDCLLIQLDKAINDGTDIIFILIKILYNHYIKYNNLIPEFKKFLEYAANFYRNNNIYKLEYEKFLELILDFIAQKCSNYFQNFNPNKKTKNKIFCEIFLGLFNKQKEIRKNGNILFIRNDPFEEWYNFKRKVKANNAKKKEDLIRELEELGELGELTNEQKSNYGKRIRNLLPFEQYKNNKKIRSLSEFF